MHIERLQTLHLYKFPRWVNSLHPGHTTKSILAVNAFNTFPAFSASAEIEGRIFDTSLSVVLGLPMLFRVDNSFLNSEKQLWLANSFRFIVSKQVEHCTGYNSHSRICSQSFSCTSINSQYWQIIGLSGQFFSWVSLVVLGSWEQFEEIAPNAMPPT